MSEDLFSVLAAIGIIALVYRWFTTTPSPSPNGLNSATSLTALQRRAMTLPRAQVDRLLTMFPQLTENEVRYALVVTHGGAEAVAERVLIRGGLEPIQICTKEARIDVIACARNPQPPPNFFPQSNAPSTIPPTSNSNNANTTSSTTNLSKMNPSLITKLSLQPFKADQDQTMEAKKDWTWEESKLRIKNLNLNSSNEDESPGSSGLKGRKAKMVLEARWKLLQKDKKGKSTAAN